MITQGKILVADDEDTFRESTLALLRRAGHECLGAANAQAALDILNTTECDLLISDIKMPGNAGLELLRSLQKLAPNLPIILATGYPSVETAVPAVEFRVVAYLVKPIAPEELLKLVQRTLEQYRASRAVTENLRRLADWNRDLQSIITHLHPTPSESFNQTLATFLTLTLRNIIGALSDLRNVIQLMAEGKPTPETKQALETSRPLMLTAALQDAVHAIERTKSSFKSRELAELRQRLEALLRESSAS